MNHRLTVVAAAATALASTALFSLIMGGKWFWGGLGAIILVAATGTVTRHRLLRRVPAAVSFLAALAVVLLYLNLIYAAKYSFGGLIPTGASITHLWTLVQQGIHETHIFAPRVPAEDGIVLLATGGIGGIAAVTDLIAVRLRRCALAGLPLLALFSAPIPSGADKSAVSTGVVFCLGMAGYLALLSADGRERLRLWGRLVTPWQPGVDEPDESQTAPNTRALAASGRRIGLAAVALALFTPLLVPSLQAHKLLSGGPAVNRPGTGGGPGGGQLPDPVAQMTQDLQEGKPQVVLTYHTSVPASQHPPYLQAYVLNSLTADSGTLTLTGKGQQLGRNGELPAVPGLARQSRWNQITTSVTVNQGTRSPLVDSFLPMPYPARALSPATGWRVDPGTLMTYSGQSLSGLGYSVVSDDVDPSQQQLGSSGPPPHLPGYLTIPRGLQSLRGYARQVTKGATSTLARAEALQSWFSSRGGFKYSLTAPKSTSDFLLHSKTGYCQQFAFAMAILARLLGIPSRVAVGFTAGTSLGNGNWQVKTSDAHAWPELYFAGLGWLSWEPTPPGTARGQGTAVAPAYTVPPSTTGGGQTNVTPATGDPNPETRRLNQIPLGERHQLTDTGAASGAATPGPARSGEPPVLLILIAVLLAAALAGPRVTRSFTSRRRRLTARDDAARAHAAWLELLDDLADYGIGHGPGETPRAVTRRVTAAQQLDPQAREALQRLAQAEERACYAPQPGSPAGLPADVTTVRRAVSASVSQSARWQARLWPASGLARARSALSHVLDLFGWAEVATTRLRQRLPRPRPADHG